jgi:hypothetical protein
MYGATATRKWTAAASNTSATRLYEALGFRFTNPFVGIALQPPA